MNIPTSKLKANPTNPRVLRDEKFAKLKQSIQDFPDMLNKRPIVAVTDTDGKLMVLGGNMRLRACMDLKMKEVPVILADEWTEEQRREFIIKDNVGFGEWDWDQLANEWDAGELAEWGLDAWVEPKPLSASLEGQHDSSAQSYLNNAVRQITLIYDIATHAKVVESMTAEGIKMGCEDDFSQVVANLLKCK